jgi:hypothetical protein
VQKTAGIWASRVHGVLIPRPDVLKTRLGGG